MANNPPAMNEPPVRIQFFSEDGVSLSQWWVQWFQSLFLRIGGAEGNPIIGRYLPSEADIAAADLASAAEVTLLDAATGTQWKVREIILSGGGTNFSGGGGDRNLQITDGTAVWTVIPAATLQSLAAGRWGDVAVPWPATGSDLTAETAASTDIVAKYSGGTTDYAAGSCTIIIKTERTV